MEVSIIAQCVEEASKRKDRRTILRRQKSHESERGLKRGMKKKNDGSGERSDGQCIHKNPVNSQVRERRKNEGVSE
jgi:hypothetical protein